MFRKPVSIVLICSSLLLGCHTPTDERTLMRFEPSMPATTRNAPYHGQYRLYATRERNPTTSTSAPMLDVRVARGEPIGFGRARSGAVHAVVRDELTPLPAMSASSAGVGNYVWTMQPDAGQIDSTRTALAVVAVVVVVGVAIGVAAAAASSPSVSFVAPY